MSELPHGQPAKASPPSGSAGPPGPDGPDLSRRRRGGGWSGWIKFALRWGIAVFGITWVVSGLTIRDRVHVLAEVEGRTVILDAALVEPLDPGGERAVYEDPVTGAHEEASPEQLVSGPDRRRVEILTERGVVRAEMAGMRLVERPGGRRPEIVRQLWVYEPFPSPEAQESDYAGRHVREIGLDQVVGGFSLNTPQPVVRVGLASMVRDARPVLLALAVLIFPVTLLCTGLRWWRLMRPLGLQITLGRAYALNMVGLFYNSFMLGSTGGDIIKAYYAGRHAPRGRKTAAWLSVFVDRVIGLVVLVIIGGTAASVQWIITPDKDSQVAIACLHVAWLSVALLLALTAGLFVMLNRPVRRKTGISRGFKGVLKRLPGGTEGGRLHGAFQSMYDTVDTYRQQPRAVLEACLLTVPVHGSVILSATLAGHAFGLPIAWPYYFVAVPVIVLSASIPISPQGAGVMEFFAVLLTRPQGATVSQAFALALSIRAVQILWNLTGGLFVLRGGYSAPSVEEAEVATQGDDAEEIEVEADTEAGTEGPAVELR